MKTEIVSLNSDNSEVNRMKLNPWRDFVSRSSCAAVAKLGDAQSKWLRSVWMFVLGCGVLLTAVSTYGSASSFFNMAASSEMIIEKSDNHRLDFPKFHICSSNMFNLSVLDQWGFDDERIVSYLMLATSLFCVSPTILKNYTLERELEHRLVGLMQRNNLTIEKIFQHGMLKCEDIVAGCITTTDYLDGAACCAQYFGSQSFPSSLGACVSTRPADNHFQVIPSLAFGFAVVVRNNRQKFQFDNSVVNPALANQRAVAFSVSDKWTLPAISLIRDRHYAKTGQWVSLAITKTVINDEEVTCPLLGNRRCVMRSNEDDYHYLIPGHEHYTQRNCFYAQRQAYIERYFGCYLNTLPQTRSGMPMCAPKHMIELNRQMTSKVVTAISLNRRLPIDNEPDCLGECEREVFTVSPSYSDFELAPNFSFDNWSIQTNESRDMVVLNFYYPTSTYTHLINHYPTVNQWLGVLGGNLGLFLGASMVSIIELIVFCCRCGTRRTPLSYDSAVMN